MTAAEYLKKLDAVLASRTVGGDRPEGAELEAVALGLAANAAALIETRQETTDGE